MVSDLSTIPPNESSLVGHNHPLSDPDFALEAKQSQEHILRWWGFMDAIARAARPVREMRSIAVCNGLPFGTLCRVYYGEPKRGKIGWKNTKDWRELANRAKWPDPKEANLPPQFVAWAKAIAEKHQRGKFKRAYAEIMAAFALWERNPFDQTVRIPGYETPPPRSAFKGYPEGWSESNLQRRCQSNAYEKALRHQGPKRASTFLPSVRTTRAKLEFGEVIYFDDQEHDNHVNLTGRNERSMRPQSFNALEALSASCFEVGLKPQLCNADGTRRELDQLDFFWFVMLCLTKHGYNATSGTTLIWEHGKANPDKTGLFDERLHQATGGLVRVDKSGRFGAPAFKAMLFEGQPSGNYRFKAPIESWFNLFRNYADALPAPTGRNRDEAPEESYGLLATNDHIQRKLIDQLPAEVFLRLQRPVLEWEDYTRMHRLIMSAIDARRDHALEGWRKLGFTGARYRLGHDKPWLDEADYHLIPASERALYQHIVTQPGNNELFQLSPGEVFAMRRRQLTRLPMHLVPVLAPERAWSDVTVSQSLEMTIADQWLDSEPLLFLGKVRTAQGYEVMLERGKTYKRLLNIFDPSKLWIAERDGSRKGAFIGTATRVQVSSKTDHEAILRQLGEINHVKAVENLEVHTRMQSEAAKRVAARELNRRLTNGQAATPEEKFSERCRVIADQKRVRSIDDFLSSPSPVVEEEESSL